MPNKYKVELYPKALRELDDIYRYIYEVLQAPEYALGQLDRLEAGIWKLEEFPYRCAERKNGIYAGKGYRELQVDHYTVIYRIDEENRTVLVVTVQYNKRNL
ncbi:MAG: type II toxin-antitoxin system RelE/ParE family toxin [Clostridium sp.]|nr:type II toxin-antitoxin system RelE/ParE family toxin [Clostridium sp.]